MMPEQPASPSDFSEDDRILAQLSDPLDAEAFANLMANAHAQGLSAADFVREEPKRTSRRAIRALCLRDRKRSLRALVQSVVRSLGDRPAADPAGAFSAALYGPSPPRFREPGRGRGPGPENDRGGEKRDAGGRERA